MVASAVAPTVTNPFTDQSLFAGLDEQSPPHAFASVMATFAERMHTAGMMGSNKRQHLPLIKLVISA